MFCLTGDCTYNAVFAKNLGDSLCSLLCDYLPHEAEILRLNHVQADSIDIDKSHKIIRVYANKCVESIPFREKTIKNIQDTLRNALPKSYKNYDVQLYVNGYEMSDLVPNIFRQELKVDKKRIGKYEEETNFVRNTSTPNNIVSGLQNNTLALWSSHGWYFEKKEDSWQWQRPRLFQVCEDTYTLGYVLPYLAPMLENAGAYVMMPKERDTQTNEVIVDNDTPYSQSYNEENDTENEWTRGDTTGFAISETPYSDGQNPFCYGSYRQIKAHKNGTGHANWTPDIPEDGDYAVYISYKTLDNSSPEAHYTVYHSGGSTEFIVNQNRGGSTWIYLGTFSFKKGLHPDKGRVELSNKGKNGTIITADATRFGGGMGVIAKQNGADSTFTSTKPKYLEGARYWLQWAGFPDSVYSRTNFTDDYKDDYMSRGHWVNHLIGGSSKSPHTQGMNIPVQLAFGFHTDAGQVLIDSIIGTMAIYMSESDNSQLYANGQRRIAARDLADIVQSEIVSDIRKTFRKDWTRRRLTDASYYEARVPQVPSMLLELLSHQNFTDMRYGLDPKFRFLVSRAIYKGILKFLCFQQEREYVVQPLPVRNFSAEFINLSNNVVRLNWTPTADSLEPTAVTKQYILYTATDDNGWDNGTLLNTPSTQIALEPYKIYRFKVAACNEGGQSFPSEVLAVGYVPQSTTTALIINGFHRTSAPEWFETPYYSGFLDNVDRGVPDRYDLSYTGSQYAFRKTSRYKSNATPGHGASQAIFENEKIAGNTFDFTYLHGKAIMAAGCSFVSCSDEVVSEGGFGLGSYNFVDLILGEEKSTKVGDRIMHRLYPEPLRLAIQRYLDRQHGNIFVSGAYIASDVYERDSCEKSVIRFAERTLKYTLGDRTESRRNVISNFFSPWDEFKQQYFKFEIVPNKQQYAVENPDVIDAVNGAKVIHSFEGSNQPATIGYRGRYRTIVSSVPFESIEGEENRKELMKEIVKFFAPTQ